MQPTMGRYIPNLSEQPLDVLEDLYRNGVKDLDAALGDDTITILSTNQIQFIGELIDIKGGDRESILKEMGF
mgnify:FL=1